MIMLPFYWRERNLRLFFLNTALLIVNFQTWSEALQPGQQLAVTYLDIGQGDATFLHLPRGQTILIDAGPASPEYDAGKEIVVPFLRRQGVKSLDMVFITHPHLDHFGGLAAILSAIPIKCAVFADTAYRQDLFQNLLGKLKTKQVPIHIATRGDIIDTFSPVKIWVMAPSPQNARREEDLNEASLALQIRFGKTALLFTGDLEFEGEHAMLPFGNLLRSEILQVGHHGSNTSSTEPFLELVRPGCAILSAGAFNRFEHPSPVVTKRLAALGCDTSRTDLMGGVVFTSAGREMKRIK
jgi:competence protein ComEC